MGKDTGQRQFILMPSKGLRDMEKMPIYLPVTPGNKLVSRMCVATARIQNLNISTSGQRSHSLWLQGTSSCDACCRGMLPCPHVAHGHLGLYAWSNDFHWLEHWPTPGATWNGTFGHWPCFWPCWTPAAPLSGLACGTGNFGTQGM